VARGLDHIAHAVHDLEAAAAFYRAAGFQVGARNRHPPAWGTQNHIVQLPGTFIEILGLADTSQTVPHGERFFSFGAFNGDFLQRGQGLSMLALEGHGTADAQAFRDAGVGDFQLYEFEREAKRPDGTPINVAFALAFASDKFAPDVGFFTCQHRHPEYFWNPEFQTHPNTATAVAGVVLVAPRPADHQAFLSAFAGGGDWFVTSAGVGIRTPVGEIELMEPAAFANRFGVPPPDTTSGARLAALRFSLRDMGAALALWQAASLAPLTRERCAVFGPDAALGATLVFEPI
jgi:hypothetical protein